MRDTPADQLMDLLSRSQPPRRYRATLTHYDSVSGLAKVSGSAVNPDQTTSITARVVPTLRMSAQALLHPGVNVVVEKLEGLPPYVMEVLDAEGAPLDGAVTSPNQGSTTGLGPSSYKFPADQVLSSTIGAPGLASGAVTSHAFDPNGFGTAAPGSPADLTMRQWLKQIYGLTPNDGIIR